MLKTPPFVRPYLPTDCPYLCSLYEQLGYPVEENRLQARLERLLQQETYQLWVAICQDRPIGLIGFAQMQMFEADEDYIRILALVVDRDFRRLGVGHALLEAVRSYAKKKGITALALNSGRSEERKAAHTFYENQGFVPTSFGYKQSLSIK